MNYYKRPWTETTGDDLTNAWGTSTYYFEADNENNVLRHIQIFENGKALKYDIENRMDKFGFLADQPLDEEDFNSFKIDKLEFETVWAKTLRS